MEINRKFAITIRKERIKQRLTIRELSDRAKLPIRTVFAAQSKEGIKTIQPLQKLAKALKLKFIIE